MDEGNSREDGTTLLELMVTLAISVLLFAITTTLWTPVTERVQASSVQTNLQRAFTLARTTAVHRRTIVTLCPTRQDGTCTSDWQLPVTVFLDTENLKKIKSDRQVIKRLTLHDAGRIIPSKSGSSQRRYFQFNPDGTSKGSIGNLTWCPESRTPERANHVRINFGGRLIWSRDRNGDGIVENASGNNIHCP
ncbi:GspH/FimT family pseudopilin [Marinobacter zhanjiangensis]|uniref:Type II secretion system protein H n=1 Tax=Marinobacter zhanjiangensis TaxID=578215 RepID=A0ABQ3B862_9GAMM|nr:GspH/FimT family pseudopilin [Marinobacter zhanjiangensis]GGY79588.1 type IV pilus biogenesis protein FimU [Marinobacter zhanjiangensis]